MSQIPIREPMFQKPGILSKVWTKFFERLSVSSARVSNLPVYANNAAAIAGGLSVGDFYRTGANPDPVCVVHA